jgi:hypothetical protein
MPSVPTQRHAAQRSACEAPRVPVVEEYWDGVLKRMQAEVDVFSRLVRHQGERGRENELAFVRLLAGLIPRRYGLGSGMVIDAADAFSKQMDIIVFDQSDEPTVMAQTTQLLFPVEQVRAAVEVKTTLNAEEIRDCGQKRASLGRLESRAGLVRQPVYVVLAYDADASAQTVAKNFAALPPEETPDLVCLLDPGVLLGDASLLAGDGSGLVAGTAFLHVRSDQRSRVSGTYVEPRPGEYDVARVESDLYPVAKDSSGIARVAEPARALLLFCEALLTLLAKVENAPRPWLTHYLSGETKELDWLPLGADAA